MSQPQETGVARWGTAETAALHMREHGPYARTAVLTLSAAHPRKARLVTSSRAVRDTFAGE